MLVADETLDGAVAESVTEKLGERELLELKKAFGARAAKKLGTNVQIGQSARGARGERARLLRVSGKTKKAERFLE